jgi:hypothetical protein
MAKDQYNPEKKNFICNYRQMCPQKKGKGSSEKHGGGRKKRWYEQFWRPEDPAAVGLPKNKFGMAFKRVPDRKKTKPRLSKA